MKPIALVALAAALLFGAALAGRRPPDRPRPPAPSQPAAPVQAEEAPLLPREDGPAPPPAALPPPVEEFTDDEAWGAFAESLAQLSSRSESLGPEAYRDAVLRTTAEFLEWGPAAASAFEHALTTTQAELARVEAEQAVSFPPGIEDLDDAALLRLQEEAEERFRIRKQLAFAPLDAFLAGDGRAGRLRARLEAWVESLRDYSIQGDRP